MAELTSATTDLISDSVPDQGEKFLRFFLDTDRPVLLPADQLVEILTIPMGQIVPMFQMPAWVMGVYNWRGEVLWMLDLNHFLGLTPWYQQRGYVSKHTVIVLRVQSNHGWSGDEDTVEIGLLVNRVEDMVVFDPAQIQSPSQRPDAVPGIEPFLQGYWQPSEDDLNLILNGSVLVNALSPST